MFFSLITGTIGRNKDLIRMLESLRTQIFKDFELIIVDQNDDNCIDDIVAKYAKYFTIVHLRTKKGLSRARNLAIERCSGEWCAFPDDDCEYNEDILSHIYKRITAGNQIDGISVAVKNKLGMHSAGGYMSSREQFVSRSNVWRTAVSPGLFFKCSVLRNNNILFDERLGMGTHTEFGSGEDTDFVLQLLNLSKRILYSPDIVIFHPCFNGSWDKDTCKRFLSYGQGMGAVLKKNHYGILSLIKFIGFQLIRTLQNCFCFNFGKAKLHLYMALGRLIGYIKWKN